MKKIKHKFTRYIPEDLEENTLYISTKFNTAIHLCICGCDNKVVTPLSPIDWSMKYNGKTISLDPSIGNWNFECKSHYWITDSVIIHSKKWTNKQIELVQKQEQQEKHDYFEDQNNHVVRHEEKITITTAKSNSRILNFIGNTFKKIKNLF